MSPSLRRFSLVSTVIVAIGGCGQLLGDFSVGQGDGGMEASTRPDGGGQPDGDGQEADDGSSGDASRRDGAVPDGTIHAGDGGDAAQEGEAGKAGDAGEAGACVPEDAATACSAKACGPVSDNCGAMVQCPSLCEAGTVCGGNEAGPNACGCATTCGAACVDLQTDTNNCGSCGHSCLGSGCSGGMCTPVLMAVGRFTQPCPNGLAVDGIGNVYWGVFGDDSSTTQDGTVMGMPIAGGALATLGTAQANPGALAVVAGAATSQVVWTNASVFGTGSAMTIQAPTPGHVQGTLQALALNTTLVAHPAAIAVDATFAYVLGIGGADNAIERTNAFGGGTASTVTSASGLIGCGLAVDGTNVYWSQLGAGIMKAPKTGGSAVPLTSASPGPSGIALDANDVYGIDSTTSSVLKIPLDGSSIVTLATAQQGPFGVAVDSANVYWTNSGDGTVMKAPIMGGAPVTIAVGQNSPAAIVADAQYIVWTTFGTSANSFNDGTVMKMAK
jgi:hypothetical protein